VLAANPDLMPFSTTLDVLGATQATSNDSPLPSSASGPASIDRWVGAIFDHFEVVKPLGRGGMGVVYLARDRSLDRQVAIKVLPDELAGKPELHERFIREARAQARLSSPHVVAIYFIGQTPEPRSLYFAMEYVDGEALEAPLDRKEPCDPELARRWMLDVARGLRDALRVGIIHRDVKPSNLLIDASGRVKLVDFGLAKPLDGDKKITREGVILGSPLYMAPEQARGEDLDHRADMYSLGCTFYHLLTGFPAFDGPTPLAVVTRHVSDPAPRVRDRAPGTPQPLARIIERLMMKNPAGRYDSYDDLIQAIEEAAPQHTELAGFWTRGAALAIDVVLALVLLATMGALKMPWLAVPLQLAYMTAVHATTGQTLGKFMMRIRVVDSKNNPLGLKAALIRTAASLWMPAFFGLLTLATAGFNRLTGMLDTLSAHDLAEIQPLLVGIIMGNLLLVLAYLGGLGLAMVHPQKLAIHDMFAGSRVIYHHQRPTLPRPLPRRAA